MNTLQFKKYMYNLAMQGKFNTQNYNDESASTLLNDIINHREQLIKDKKIKKNKDLEIIFKKNGKYYKSAGNNSPVCIDDEIPFKVPDNWIWCTLGSIVSVKGGKRVPKGYKLLDEPTPHIYIRVTDMKNGTIIKDDLKYIDDEIFEKIKNYIINKEDLYITVAGTIGQIGSVPDYFDGMNLTENANKITDISINKSFLKYLLMSDIVQSQLLDKTTQVAQPKLAIKRILSVKIPLPPIEEQQRIVNILKDVDNYVLLDEKLNNITNYFVNTFKRLILQEAVQGKLVPQDSNDNPASVLLENIKQEKEQLIKAKKIKKNNKESVIFKENGHYYEQVGKKESVCIDDDLPFEIPDSWEWCKLENIIELISGRDLKKSQYNDSEVGMPYITGASNIVDEDLIINRWTDNPAVIAIKNDILLTCKGTVGKILILNENEVHIARQIMSIRVIDGNLIDRDYIVVFLKYYVNKLIIAAKSMIPGISREDVLKINIPLPPLNEQKCIVDKVEQLFENVDVLVDG